MLQNRDIYVLHPWAFNMLYPFIQIYSISSVQAFQDMYFMRYIVAKRKLYDYEETNIQYIQRGRFRTTVVCNNNSMTIFNRSIQKQTVDRQV
jgi:hypothetical protein